MKRCLLLVTATLPFSLLSFLSFLMLATIATSVRGQAYLYWSQNGRQLNTTDIVRTPLSGGPSEIILSEPYAPAANNGVFQGLAFDLVNRHLYSTDSAQIFRTNLDGTGRVNLARPVLTGIFGIVDVEIDLDARRLYYPVDLGVRSVSLDGTGDSLVASFTPSGAAGSAGVALDRAGGKLYFTTYNASDPVMVANLNGTSVQRFCGFSDTAGGHDVEVDPVGGMLFWTRRGANGINAARLDCTGGVQRIFSGPGPTNGVPGLHFDPVDRKLYAFSNNSIIRLNPDGSALETVTSSVQGAVFLATLTPSCEDILFGSIDTAINGPKIVATFAPSGGLENAARACGVHHFNWTNRVINHPQSWDHVAIDRVAALAGRFVEIRDIDEARLWDPLINEPGEDGTIGIKTGYPNVFVVVSADKGPFDENQPY